MKPFKEYTQDELIALVRHYQEREQYFARLLGVADGGQFRADWEAPILRLIQERDALKEKVENSDDTSDKTRKKLANVEALTSLLIRAKPFTEGNPLYKEIAKFLADQPDPQLSRDALEVAMINLMVWHYRYQSDVDDAEKVDLNWILSILGKPKRYHGVPDK